VLVLAHDVLNKSSEQRVLALRNKFLRDSHVVKLEFESLLFMVFESLSYYLLTRDEISDDLSVQGEFYLENKWSLI
jgi:hypothetical protein